MLREIAIRDNHDRGHHRRLGNTGRGYRTESKGQRRPKPDPPPLTEARDVASTYRVGGAYYKRLVYVSAPNDKFKLAF
jgi:hypothetical protein